MRTWVRTRWAGRCGLCGATLEAGVAVQVITCRLVKRRLVRCQTCADTPVPPDVPVWPTRSPELTPVQSMTAIRDAVNLDDWKQRQTKEP